MQTLLIGGPAALATIAALVWVIGVYTGLTRLRSLVQESWRQLDQELGRRLDLIPNLVETVRGYSAPQDHGTLDAVLRARSAAIAPRLSPAERAAAEGTLAVALDRLLALAEGSPELSANEEVASLRSALAEAGDLIAAGRRVYNANVRGFNTRVHAVPAGVLAGTLRITPIEPFDADARVGPDPVDSASTAPASD